MTLCCQGYEDIVSLNMKGGKTHVSRNERKRALFDCRELKQRQQRRRGHA